MASTGCQRNGPVATGTAQTNTWIALLGRRDMPTDGVEDYCTYLGPALAERGVELRQVRVPWTEGWLRALRGLWRESAAWRGTWVLIQYTGLGWSRRGFSFGALAALAILRRRGVRCAVVFHEASRQPVGARLRERFRGACQNWVIRRLYRKAHKAIFTVPLETISWLRKREAKAVFIPIGANIPERVARRAAPIGADREKTVIIFGVTGMPQTDREVDEIASVMKGTSRAIANLRLVVVGRGASEAREKLERALEGANMSLVVRGILPAEEITREFESADALLFIRGAITPQRGSAIAGIACGLPIVGYRKGNVSEPLRDAGVEWSPWGDRDSLVRGLTRVLSDSSRWAELHERNLEAQKKYLSWDTIADTFVRSLETGVSGANDGN